MKRIKTNSSILVLLIVMLAAAFCSQSAFASGGDVIWEYGITPDVGKQEAKAMVVDSAGNTIVVGFSNQSGTDDYYVAKIKADGSGVLWSADYDTSGGNDYATAVVLDSNDNAVVTGYLWNGTNYDFHTIKYNSADGTVLWQHSFNASMSGDDYNTSIAVDSLNNVYIGGNSQADAGKDDIIVIKYGPNGPNPDGTPIWQTTYNGAAGGQDRITSIAAGVGGIVVAGMSENSNPDFDALTIKLAYDGSLLWEKRKAASGYDRAEAARIDTLGNVLMAATLYNGSSKDIYVVKYDASTGTVLWEDTYDGGYNEEPEDMFIDSFGDVYITGYSFVITSADDIFTAKYDGSTGVRLWSAVFNSGSGNNDTGKQIMVDPSGDVFVVADMFDSQADNYNFQTLKYSRNSGNLLWHEIFDGTAAKNDRVAGVGLTSTGEVITAGWTDTWTSGASDCDFYTIKYEPGLLNPPTGLTAAASSTSQIDLAWSDNAANEDGFKLERKIGDFGTYAEVADLGANTTAYNNTGLNADTKYYYRVKAYNSADGDSYYSNEVYAVTTIVSFGTPSTTYTYSGADAGDDKVTAMSVGPDYSPVVTGYSYSLAGQFDYYTIKLDRGDLGLTWGSRYDSDQNDMDMPVSILADSNNDVLVSGTSYLYSVQSGENTNDIYTIQYPSTGPPENWNDQYNGPAGDDDRSSLVDVSTDSSNNYVVVGYGRNDDWNDDIYVVKYLADGTREWAAAPYDGGVMGHDYPSAVSFDSAGDIIVSGYTYNGSDYDFFVRKYSGIDGSPTWTDVYDIAATGNDYSRALVIDSDGNAYVTGSAVTASGNDDIYTIKYDGVDGTRLWEKSYNGLADGVDEAIGIKRDPVNGELVVAGTALVSPDNNDIHMIRYDALGNVVWERTLDRPDDNDFAVSMGIDLSGTVHIAGDTENGTNGDILSVQYTGAGSFLGGMIYNGIADAGDGASAVAVNSLGEAFIGGYTINANGDSDYVVYKVTNNILQAPAPFEVTPIYEDSVLNWTDNSLDEDGFHIERKIGACSSSSLWTPLYTAVQDDTSYTDANLSIGAEYCYRIRTYKNNGETSRWVERGITTYYPSAPIDLAVSNVDTTTVELTWTDTTTGEEGFILERCLGTDCTDFALLATLSPDVTSYADASVCNTTGYSYQVKAFKTGRWNTGYSNVATITTITPPVPAGITAARISETQININWIDNADDETGFEIQRCTGDALSCTDDIDFTTTVQSTPPYNSSPSMLLHMDEEAWNGTVDEVNDSTGSENHGRAYGNADTVTDGKYGRGGSFNGSGDYVDVGSVDLGASWTMEVWFKYPLASAGSWNTLTRGSSADHQVIVQRSSMLLGTYNNGASTFVSSGFYMNTLSDGWHHMAAVGNGGQTMFYIDGAIAGTASYQSTSDIRSIGNYWGGSQQFGTIDEFALFSSALDGAEIVEHYNNGINILLQYNDTDVTYSTNYTYRVRSYKNTTCSWNSGLSVSVSDTTTINGPDSLSAQKADTTQVNLSWNDNTVSEDGFLIQRCTGLTCDFTTVDEFTVDADVTSYVDVAGCENTSYRYRVRAFRTSEWASLFSNTVSATTDAITDPASLSAVVVSEQQIDLAWTDNMDDEEGYEIQRCEGDAASCTVDADFTYSTNYISGLQGSVLYYRMNELSWNSTTGEVVDASGSQRHGTANNGAAITSEGKKDNAGSFDGSNDYVYTPLNIDQGGSKAYTFEAWVYPTSTSSGRHHVIGTDNGGYDWSLLREGGNWIIFNGIGSWNTGMSVDINQWQHIVAVFDPAAGIKFYKNAGSPSSTGTIAYDGSDNNINIGRSPGYGEYFNGRIDEVIIYERALSAEDVQARYDSVDSGSMKYSDTGLNAGTAYTYRVRAFKNSICNWLTAFSNTDDAATLLPPPPTDLTATVVNTTQIDLAWLDNTDSETMFKIQRCTGASCDFSTVDEFTVTPDATGYADTSVCENMTYRYRVRAEKDTVPSYETDWAVLAGDVSTPVSVTPSELTATTITESQIDIEWNINTTDETGFKIERCTGDSCTDFQPLVTVSSGVAGNVMLLHMDESSWNGTVDEVRDSTASGNDGISRNSADTVPEGKFGRAGSFSGGSTYVEVPDSAALDITSVITMEAWVYLDSYQTEWSLVMMKGDTSNNRAYGMWVRNTGDILISYRSSNVWYQLNPSGQGFTTGGWHHLTGIIDTANDYRAIYIDGVKKVEDNAGLPSMTANNYSLFVGSRNGTWPTKGKIDEAAVYNRVLTEQEIQSHFINGVKNNRYSDTGLQVEETYRYRMYAYKDASCGWSTGFTPEAESITIPPVPANFTATAVGTTQVDLGWAESNDTEEGFKIERCTGLDCTGFLEIGTVVTDITDYSDITACENTDYRYRVKSYKGVEWESLYSEEQPVKTPEKVAPTNLTASWVSEVRIDIAWDDNTPGETGFILERCSGDSCIDFEELVTLVADQNTYSDDGITPETSYTYRVKAYKTADCGWITGYSNSSTSITTIAEPGSLTATAINTTDVSLTWTDNTASEYGFSIERCTGVSCSGFSEIGTTDSDTTSYIDDSACNSTTYTYRVRGKKEGELSSNGGGCWTRMAPIVISDFAKDYQTVLTIPYSAGIQADFSDIRFYDASTGSERPYWIASKTDGVTADVYFKTHGVNDLYMYYGNASAAGVSSGAKTFDLYDPSNTGLVSGFTKSGSNPVLNLGAANAWDDGHLYGITVMQDEGIYKMWYSGSDGVYFRIGYATSPDGKTWTRNSSSPVIDLGVNGTWDDYHVAYPNVIKDNGVYKMWYSGSNGLNWRIGYATSADGINWTKSVSNPVINLGSGGTWDNTHLLAGKVLKENENTYKMWYSGHDGTRYTIGYAISTNGISWSKSGSNPVLNLSSSGVWDDLHVYLPTVIREENGAYKMWYTGHDNTNTRIGFASSTDGTSWTKYSSNPVVNIGAEGTWDDVHAYSPSVIRNSEGVYEMWYAGHNGSNWRIGYSSVRPAKFAASEPSASIGAEEQSACYAYASWDTGYSLEAAVATMTLSSPSDLLTVAIGDTQSDLTWTDNSIDESGFSIERCDGESCIDYAEIDTAGANSESYRDITISPATTYCYRVTAVKTAVCGWSTVYTNESCDLSYSASPTGLTAIALDSQTIQLDWTDVSYDEEGFELEKRLFNGTFVRIAAFGPNETTYTDSIGIEPGKEHSYRVRSFRGADNSPYSNVASVTTPEWIEGDGTCAE